MTEYTRLWGIFVTAFGIVYIAIPAIIDLAIEKGLVDAPDNKRKVHKNTTPTLGGIAIFGGILLSATIFIRIEYLPYLQFVLAAMSILFFIGAKDDVYPLTPRKKLMGQVIAAFVLTYFGNIRLQSLYGIFGVWNLSPWVSIVLTIFVIVIIINAFNLIDGIDGLAGVISVFVITVFAMWFFFAREFELVVLSFACIGAILAFLVYNISPAKIFMGDTGSLILGLMCATLAIKFIEFNQVKVDPYFIEAAPTVAIAILIIPIFDLIRAFTVRILNGKHPFKGDRNHVHQIMLRLGMSHSYATMALLCINIIIASVAYHFRFLGSLKLLVLIMVLCIAIFEGLNYLARKKEKQNKLE